MASVIGNLGKIPELRKRILFTVAMLGVYRIGVFVTVPGVDRGIVQQLMGSASGFLGLFNMFSGGALKQMSVFALGIMPYISASIILQLMAVVVPAVERLQKEGDCNLSVVSRQSPRDQIGVTAIYRHWEQKSFSFSIKQFIGLAGDAFKAAWLYLLGEDRFCIKNLRKTVKNWPCHLSTGKIR